eukprot:2265775-Rhodomonas_salina.1
MRRSSLLLVKTERPSHPGIPGARVDRPGYGYPGTRVPGYQKLGRVPGYLGTRLGHRQTTRVPRVAVFVAVPGVPEYQVARVPGYGYRGYPGT